MNQRIHFKKITPVLVPGNKISMVNKTSFLFGVYTFKKSENKQKNMK